MSNSCVAVTPDAIARGISEWRSGAFQSLGFLALILTPICRVAIAGYNYLRRGERALFVISLTVLGILGLGISLGLKH